MRKMWTQTWDEMNEFFITMGLRSSLSNLAKKKRVWIIAFRPSQYTTLNKILSLLSLLKSPMPVPTTFNQACKI